MTTEVFTQRCDTLVIGSGVAGLSAALEAARSGSVILLTKERLKDSNTQRAQGGIAMAVGPGDSPDLHLQDTLHAGAGLCDPRAVRALVEAGPKALDILLSLGVHFDEHAGQLSLGREAAHSRNRIVHARGDATGAELQDALTLALTNTPNILVQEWCIGLDFLVHDGRCAGLLALHARTGALAAYLADAVLLASGGLGQLYTITTNPTITTGDGMAMAFRAGAPLMDMEFIQFHPTALYRSGAHTHEPLFLISEALRGEGAVLLNSRRERFMDRYDPHMELAPRDVVSRAIYQEMRRTGSPYVYLDTTPIPDFDGRFPTISATCTRLGIDLDQHLIPVAPAAHYMMGGVETDLDGRSGLPGLYAAGEVASNGVHGANRLASNSLLEGLVFGTRMAQAAHSDHPAPARPDPAAVLAACTHSALGTRGAPAQKDSRTLARMSAQAQAWRSAVQDAMWDHVGIVRDEAGLAGGEAALELLNAESREAAHPEMGLLPGYWEVRNMILLGSVMARAARRRTESRGAHYRTDYPAQDDARWRVRQRITRDGIDTASISGDPILRS